MDFIDKNDKPSDFLAKKDKVQSELKEIKFKRKREDNEFKWIGKQQDVIKQNWMLTPDKMLKRAFETIFGNGSTPRKIDRKRIPPLHYDILVGNGYAKNLPNLGVCILTDKAFEDKDKILCKNG